MKRYPKIILSAAVIVCCLFAFAYVSAKELTPRKDDLYNQIELFAAAIGVIRSEYVDEVNSKDLIYGAMRGMLSSLDSHSQFMDPEEYNEMKVETEGRFGGIGIELTMKDNMPTVITPIEDTPAFKAGLKPNDKLIKIDGKSTQDLALDDVVKLLRGDSGTTVLLTVLREQEKRFIDFSIIRSIIMIKSIKEASVLENKIGYIKLIEFQENTPKDFIKAFKGLEAKGIDGLILDLRNNPGGLLDVSIKVAQVVLPAGETIVSTKGRAKNQDAVYKADYKKPVLEIPLIVLVNEGSASASEIVAAAIKDNKRGIIVGTKTFGKGSVQTVIPLGDGSALRLTTAKYFTPSGQAIHNEGIAPDILVNNPQQKEEQKEKEEKPYDRQLDTAVSLMKCIKMIKK
ncbi:MAG: S41 family peptidase [Candidatus Omnitrophica bacterium]|nr:S41 family peptidase [Candidatus Omnitrophota bacterium]